MFEFITDQFGILSLRIFLISMLLFFTGYALAPTVYFKDIKTLKAYPMWVALRLEEWAKKEWNSLLLFLLIFLLNLTSLTVNLFSGYAPIVPILFALWTGLNIGIVTYHTLEGDLYYASLINPVALFELPAAFISFTLAIQFNLRFWEGHPFQIPPPDFAQYINFYMMTVIPLLILAGIIETALIQLSKKFEDQDQNKN